MKAMFSGLVRLDYAAARSGLEWPFKSLGQRNLGAELYFTLRFWKKSLQELRAAMERKTYLKRYRLCVDSIGIPVVIRRSADEATLKADDLGSSRQVAVQVGPASALGAAERTKLEAEANTAQQINHINIPVLRDFGFEEDQLVYVTEYFEGTTGDDWIKTKGTMPASTVLRIASQVVKALGAANSHGIVHYAVHPGNIMLIQGKTVEGEEPLIKMLNLLGSAPALPLSGPNGSALLIPADFASPEQRKDGTVDFRSEVYSLGCTLWFLLKGVPPAGGAAALEGATGLSVPLRQLLTEMLAENPKDRPSDLVVFQRQIRDCLAQVERDEAAPALAPEIQPLRRPRSAWRLLALAAILVGLATLAAFVLWQQTPRQRAVEVATAVPEASAIPFVTSAPPAVASAAERATGEAPKAPGLTLNVGAHGNGAEASISNKIAANEASLLARLAPQDSLLSTSNLDIMPGVPAAQENMEQPAPVVASSSSFPDPGIAVMAVEPELLPRVMGAPPPGEGPDESETPSAEISAAPPAAAEIEEAEEGIKKGNSLESPQNAPEEITARVPKSSMKKKSDAKPSRPLLVRDYIPRTTVGHIFPLWVEKPVEDAAPKPSPPVKRSQPHRLHPGASVGHIFYPVSSGRPDTGSSGPTSGEARRRSSPSVRTPAKKPPVSDPDPAT
jgi:serine/threonine protein kinase